MRLLICVMLLSALTASAQNQKVGTGANFYSREKEVALGASLAQNVQRSTTALNSPAALDYVQRLGAKLAAQLPEPRYSYTFALLASDESNAVHEPLSLPGGYIFVPASLFLAAQDEAEFAGMLAHAMAHIAARHGTRAETSAQLSQISTIPLIFYGWAGFGSRTAAVIPVSFLRLERTYEREADLIAVKLLSSAGYDPQALVRYMIRVWPVNPPDPDGDTRIATMQTAIQQLPPENPDDEFLRIQREIRFLSR